MSDEILPKTRSLTGRRGWLALALLAATLGVWWSARRVADPVLATPQLAVAAVRGKSLYFNGEAQMWLKALRPELLSAEAADAGSELVRAFVQAVENPKQFRQLDRQHRFDELLLVGNPSKYRPLVEHLVDTGDFRPVYVDHWAVILQRGPERAWKSEDLAPVRAALAKLSARDRAVALSEVAVRLSALRRVEDARALLDEAEKLDANSATMWNGRGVLHAQRGEWKEALACADRALKGKLEPLSAVATKTQALYAMKQFGPAYELSAKLVKEVPQDPGILFFHAKIAHEARAYRAEIEALEKLIAMAEAARRPVAGYCVYLGQAYASVSDAKRAVEAFTRALEDPELPKDQREFSEENIRRIRSRAGG